MGRRPISCRCRSSGWWRRGAAEVRGLRRGPGLGPDPQGDVERFDADGELAAPVGPDRDPAGGAVVGQPSELEPPGAGRAVDGELFHPADDQLAGGHPGRWRPPVHLFQQRDVEGAGLVVESHGPHIARPAPGPADDGREPADGPRVDGAHRPRGAPGFGEFDVCPPTVHLLGSIRRPGPGALVEAACGAIRPMRSGPVSRRGSERAAGPRAAGAAAGTAGATAAATWWSTTRTAAPLVPAAGPPAAGSATARRRWTAAPGGPRLSDAAPASTPARPAAGRRGSGPARCRTPDVPSGAARRRPGPGPRAGPGSAAGPLR